MFAFSLKAPAHALALLLLALSFLFASPARAEDDYLAPEVAFKFSARMVDPQTVAVTYDIADGYYMYRERFKFAAANATLGTPAIPPGKVKFDETFQKEVETYRKTVTITIPVEASGMFTLTVTSQGCADAGLCYAPQEAVARLVGAAGSPPTPAMSKPPASIAAASIAVAKATQEADIAALTSKPPAPAAQAPAPAAVQAPAAAPATSTGDGAALLGGGKLWLIIPTFIALGLGLSFTPCVLPMVPILASIIVGEGAGTTRARGFILALAYSLGMALVYTALGVAAGLMGEGLAAELQKPWILIGVGIMIVALSLSMFGVYELQVPSFLQHRLVDASGRQSAGKLLGVFIMGALSALIVGPCVAAPLAGALTFIFQSRDGVVGGVALFSLAMGMSIPLLLVGLSAGSLLPRTGAWMNHVKRFFGVTMLGMALWLTSPVLPPLLQMLLWSALLLGYGVYMLRHVRHWVGLALGVVCAILGAIELLGMATGGRDPLAPLAHLGVGSAQHGLAFTRIKTLAQLDLALAHNAGKTAMLDFYADWCVSCKEMEKLTFVDARIKQRLAGTLLLQVDVSANDADDKAMLKRFGLFGPPGIILFDQRGQEIAGSRVIGYQNADKFTTSLKKLD
ncbi:protein-disulfide reductase DsbD [Massilia sp. P8910]|uniref:protein-disulfide reductase DsbD n=1 Tax=Massilia antarctica TaxID=2765360 RepID=UPI001E434D90|nr:protein-disulfide reductase DsbD [Massilia antarctica]MCE3606787.1 protein-disulfide reductase DsbD [Massilia antarctica]